MKIYPEKLSEILKDKNITQKELAKELNLTETTISRYMSGNYAPTKSVVINIAEILGVKITDFAEQPEIKKLYKIKKTETQNNDNTSKIVNNTTLQQQLINDTVSFWQDDDIRIIQRARTNMSYDERKKMMEILKLTFEDAFKDIGE